MSHRRKNIEEKQKIESKLAIENERRKKIIVSAIAGAVMVAAIAGILMLRNPPHVKNEERWLTFNNTTNPVIGIRTNYGTMYVELYPDKAPITVANFLRYVNDSFYDGLIFHRVIDGFMIQGGGFYPNMTQKIATYPPIKLEVSEELKHVDGAISMARTSDPDSATSQFFICDGAQPHLDGNYAVFGRVIHGIEVLRDISAVATHSVGYYRDVPVKSVIIEKAKQIQ